MIKQHTITNPADLIPTNEVLFFFVVFIINKIRCLFKNKRIDTRIPSTLYE